MEARAAGAPVVAMRTTVGVRRTAAGAGRVSRPLRWDSGPETARFMRRARLAPGTRTGPGRGGSTAADPVPIIRMRRRRKSRPAGAADLVTHRGARQPGRAGTAGRTATRRDRWPLPAREPATRGAGGGQDSPGSARTRTNFPAGALTAGRPGLERGREPARRRGRFPEAPRAARARADTRHQVRPWRRGSATAGPRPGSGPRPGRDPRAGAQGPGPARTRPATGGGPALFMGRKLGRLEEAAPPHRDGGPPPCACSARAGAGPRRRRLCRRSVTPLAASESSSVPPPPPCPHLGPRLVWGQTRALFPGTRCRHWKGRAGGGGPSARPEPAPAPVGGGRSGRPHHPRPGSAHGPGKRDRPLPGQQRRVRARARLTDPGSGG